MELFYLKKEIKRLVKKHSIVITTKRFKGPSGRSWVSPKIIKIPRLITIENIALTFHEIGHIVLNHVKSKKALYIEEYEAEQYALKKLREFNVHRYEREAYKKYLARAKRYVKNHISEDEEKVRKTILNWCKNAT